MRNFSTSFNGYNKNEVIDFVTEVTNKYSRLLNAYKKIYADIEAKDKIIERYTNIEASLNRAIIVAEESSSQMKKIARDESNSIIEDAKKNASRIVNDALLKAERIDSEAELLKRKVIQYKRRVKQIMDEQMAMMDEINELDTKY